MVNAWPIAMALFALDPSSPAEHETREAVRLPDSFFQGDLTGGVERPARLPYQLAPGYRVIITPGARTSLPRYPVRPGPGDPHREWDGRQQDGSHRHRARSQE